MKRIALSSLLAFGIVLSAVGNVHADANQNGRIYSDGSLYDWTYIGYNQQLEIRKISGSSYTNMNSYDQLASDIRSISLYDMVSSYYTVYRFVTLDLEMENVTDIYIHDNCTEVSDLGMFPALQGIHISNDRAEEITLDFDSDLIGRMPVIEISDSSADVIADFTSWNNADATSDLLVPLSYGNGQVSYFFSGNDSVQEVTFEAGTSVIPEESFNDCDALTGVSIPSGVTTIESRAFAQCDVLRSIDIPASVTAISNDAFEETPVETINYGGTKAQWYGIVHGYTSAGSRDYADNVLHLNGTIVNCSDGTIRISSSSQPGQWFQSSYGWVNENGGWYYYTENGGIWAGVIVEIDGRSYYFDASGVMQTGWVSLNGSWYHFAGNGAMQTGWQKIGNNWYYFDATGVMQTGWKAINGRWYYLSSSGAMLTGWQKINNTWYYFDPSGAMLTGWQKISNKWYYFNASGAMLTGWQKINGSWYYFMPSGEMKTGWLQIGNNWYYLNGSGVMVTGDVYIGGRLYHFSSSGVWIS